MLLAGRLAEEMVPGVDASVSDEWLRSVIRRLRAGDTEIANDDDAKVLTALGVEALTDEELISDYRALEEETRKLLEDPDISRAIDALARALLREGKGRLEGEPAMALVDNTEDEAALSEGALRRREEEWLLEVVALAACDLEKDGEPPAETDEGDEGW
jgi:hypothetical protein